MVNEYSMRTDASYGGQLALVIRSIIVCVFDYLQVIKGSANANNMKNTKKNKPKLMVSDY